MREKKSGKKQAKQEKKQKKQAKQEKQDSYIQSNNQKKRSNKADQNKQANKNITEDKRNRKRPNSQEKQSKQSKQSKQKNGEDENKCIKLNEERILAYLVDEDDEEIGVLYKDNSGNEVELYYDEISFSNSNSQIHSSVDDDCEEIEIDPNSVLYYLVSPEGIELGFVALNQEGNKEEFLYPESSQERFFLLDELDKKLLHAQGVAGAASSLVSAGANAAGGVVNKVAGKEVVKTKKNLTPKASNNDLSDDLPDGQCFQEMFNTFKEVAIEGYAAFSGVMDQVDDVRDQIDEMNPKKRRERRRAQKINHEKVSNSTAAGSAHANSSNMNSADTSTAGSGALDASSADTSAVGTSTADMSSAGNGALDTNSEDVTSAGASTTDTSTAGSGSTGSGDANSSDNSSANASSGDTN